MPIAFVFEPLPLVRRIALVKIQVPFVVSGMQLFLPPLASLKDVTSEFGYCAVTGKKVFDELVGMDLAEVTAEWPGRLRLLVHGREMWDRALSALRSPVRREWLSRAFPSSVISFW